MWAYAGTINLIRLTYQDYKNNMMINDKYNWFMLGVSIGLFAIFKHRFIYVLGLIFGSIFISKVLIRLKALGDGDISAINWLYLGYGIIGIKPLVTFFLCFTTILTLYFSLKYLISKILKGNFKQKMPFFAVLLVCFIVTNILAKLY